MQHIDNLYTTQSAVRTEWRNEIDTLKKHLTRVEAAVDRLTAIIEKARAKHKVKQCA